MAILPKGDIDKLLRSIQYIEPDLSNIKMEIWEEDCKTEYRPIYINNTPHYNQHITIEHPFDEDDPKRPNPYPILANKYSGTFKTLEELDNATL